MPNNGRSPLLRHCFPDHSLVWVSSSRSFTHRPRFSNHCFQKDANLRISAVELIGHPWMLKQGNELGGNEGCYLLLTVWDHVVAVTLAMWYWKFGSGTKR